MRTNAAFPCLILAMKKKSTKPEDFLAANGTVGSPPRWLSNINTRNPESGSQGEQSPFPLEMLLPAHFLQNRSSGESATEQAQIDNVQTRVSGAREIDGEQSPFATRTLKFLDLLGQLLLARSFFGEATIYIYVGSGKSPGTRTLADTIIGFIQLSTRNKPETRDVETPSENKDVNLNIGNSARSGIIGLLNPPFSLIDSEGLSRSSVTCEGVIDADEPPPSLSHEANKGLCNADTGAARHVDASTEKSAGFQLRSKFTHGGQIPDLAGNGHAGQKRAESLFGSGKTSGLTRNRQAGVKLFNLDARTDKMDARARSQIKHPWRTIGRCVDCALRRCKASRTAALGGSVSSRSASRIQLMAIGGIRVEPARNTRIRAGKRLKRRANARKHELLMGNKLPGVFWKRPESAIGR